MGFDLAGIPPDALARALPGASVATALTAALESAASAHVLAAIEAATREVVASPRASGLALEPDGEPGLDSVPGWDAAAPAATGGPQPPWRP